MESGIWKTRRVSFKSSHDWRTRKRNCISDKIVISSNFPSRLSGIRNFVDAFRICGLWSKMRQKYREYKLYLSWKSFDRKTCCFELLNARKIRTKYWISGSLFTPSNMKNSPVVGMTKLSRQQEIFYDVRGLAQGDCNGYHTARGAICLTLGYSEAFCFDDIVILFWRSF